MPVESKRVLVVDDEQEVTFALHAYFLGKGYEMLTALDGMQAMRMLRQHPIDLVLLDMKMPGVNGIEVLKFIHSNNPETKVIVVTAYDDQFQEMVESLGVDGFLMKPFGIEALTLTIEGVLAGGREKDQSEQIPQDIVSLTQGPRARAKLLFLESSEYTYDLKKIFFSDAEKCGGVYEIESAYTTKEALSKLEKHRPDILLVDLEMLGHAGEVALKAMSSSARPKDLVIHGSGAGLKTAQNAQMEDLSKRGVRMVFNESFTRAGLVRLAEVVRKTSIANGLVEVSG